MVDKDHPIIWGTIADVIEVLYSKTLKVRGEAKIL